MKRLFAILVCLSLLGPAIARATTAPAQRLPSAVLVYPLVQVDGGGLTRDTRIELLNLSGQPQSLQCAYITSGSCTETDFFVSLTANQPMSWLASRGTSNVSTGSAVPPFMGLGQLECVVLPSRPEIEHHNAIQGRALIFGSDGQTIGYSAVGFERLTAGDFTGTVSLDGVTYAQCPDELHFVFLAGNGASDGELVLVPCSGNPLSTPQAVTVQFTVVNEFEQVLSASMSIKCFDRRALQKISSAFARETLGTDTGHVTVRGVQVPVMGLMIDRFTPGAVSTSGNEPILRGGRSAELVIP